MAAVEAREPPLGLEVLIVLRHDRAARRRCDDALSRDLRQRVGRAAADAFDRPAADAERAGVQHRASLRRLPEERLHALDAQAVRPAIGRADDVEVEPRGVGVADADVPAGRRSRERSAFQVCTGPSP